MTLETWQHCGKHRDLIPHCFLLLNQLDLTFAVMSGRSRAGLNLSIHAEAGEPPLSGDGLTPVVFLALGGLGAKLDVVRSFFILLQFLAIIAALVP